MLSDLSLSLIHIWIHTNRRVARAALFQAGAGHGLRPRDQPRLGPESAGGMDAVSYTHLDVYKRQT